MMSTGQEDPGNPTMIQQYGCDLWSHWYWVEILKGRPLFKTPEIITAEYQRLLTNGVQEIAPDCTIENGEELFSLCGCQPITGLQSDQESLP